MTRFISLAACLLAAFVMANPVPIQDNKESPKEAATQIKIQFHDGSIIIGDVKDLVMDVSTQFGTLKVPVKNIANIEFGYHLTDDESAVADVAVKKLNSANYKEREIASNNLLKVGSRAYRIVHFFKTDDLEVKRRIEAYKIKSQAKAELLYDLIHTDHDFKIKGEILTKSFDVYTNIFGKLVVNVVAIQRISVVLKTGTKTISTDADWRHLTYVFNRELMKINVTGQVDLWPTTPGQYICDANGHQLTVGRTGTDMFKAGQLIGKIDNGVPFIIGSNTVITEKGSGMLFVKIVQNPWNGNSSGSYNVTFGQ